MILVNGKREEVVSRQSDKSDCQRHALLNLLQTLSRRGYRFITPTPSTHERVIRRPSRQVARDFSDVLGWSLPFERSIVPQEIFDLLSAAGVVSPRDGLLQADVRVSSVHDTLFLHSAYPTLAQDAVFLGPDSYRFADLIVSNIADIPHDARILDYAAGAGVGGIAAARHLRHSWLVLADINPKASWLSSINAEAAGLAHETVNARAPCEVDGCFDLIVTHPPFMMDDSKRAYRDGGDLYGARLSLDWALEAIGKLKPGGKLVLHTGVSIVEGRDIFLEGIEQAQLGPAWKVDYRELDPDIFSEDLDTSAYVRADVERIAAVGLCITRSASA